MRLAPSRFAAVRSLWTSALYAHRAGEDASVWLARCLQGHGVQSMIEAGALLPSDPEAVAYAMWRHYDDNIARAGVVVPAATTALHQR
jgi:hypothetical protein